MSDDVVTERQGLTHRIRKFGMLATIRTQLRHYLLKVRCFYLRSVWGMDIHKTARISFKSNLDRTYPKGIHIGQGSAITLEVIILSHDRARQKHLDTRIGDFCAIGARSIIMPGVTVGNHSIVGAGSVVTKDVPPNCIVAGNPARIIRTGIQTGYAGVILDPGVKPQPARQDDDAFAA